MGFSGGNALGFGLGGLIGLQISQGQEAAKQQKRALQSQEKAQDEAKAAAIRQARENDMQLNKANQKSPDISALLLGEQARKSGPSSTLLTGSSGVDPSSLRLGRVSLLGDVSQK